MTPVTVRLRLLGPVAVHVGDGPAVDVGGPRARALLARLAVDPGRVVGLDSLIDAVWEEAPPAAPGNAVQALVSRLRRAVPELSVRATPPGYLLDLPADAVDAARFERLVARAREERHPERVVALLTEAEALWRGPALADLRDLAFTAAPATRWAELRLGAAEQRLTAQLQLGRPAVVLPELEQLVAEHPLREPFSLLLVRALARLGRPAEALAAYERCRARLADELGLDPSPALQAEHLAVLRGQTPPEPPESRPARAGTTLRTSLTSFLGRDAELASLGALLDGGRLVTLLGPGGAGKTRLALEAAHRRQALLPDGVWWVELAPVADARLLPAAVLAAVGQREGTSLERVPTLVEASARLQGTFVDRRALLVLDNCEHLVGAVAQLTDELLGHCPGLQVLTTSREPLGVPGEAVLPVGPLAVPGAQDAGAADAPAVRLFADRAVAVRPEFALTPATLPSVLEICRRLDGMPLALELAAARLRTLGVAQIAARLDDRFHLLTGGSRVALPRHQTLRAVVEWSWDALDGPEQAVARRLSVFAGGATLDAVEEVCADPGWSGADVLDAVTGLVEKSMLLAVEDGGGVRYRMLETIRAYGAEQLDAAGERAAVEAAQTAWAVRLLDELDPVLRTGEQLPALHRLHAEHDGLVAVLQRAVAAGDAASAVHLGARLCWYWLVTGRQLAASRWLADVLALPGPPSALRAICQTFSAMGGADSGDWTAAVPELTAVRQLPPELTWRSAEPMAAFAWGLAEVFLGGPATVEAVEKLAANGDPWVVAGARVVGAQITENYGEFAGFEAELAAAQAAFDALGDRWGRSLAAAARGQLSAMDGDLDTALAATTEALRLSDELGTTEDSPLLRVRLAVLEAVRGDLTAAEARIRATVDDLQGDRGMALSYAEASLGGLALLDGRVAEAERWHRQALQHGTEGTGPSQVRAMVLTGLAVVLATRARREPDQAAELDREADEHLVNALDLVVRVNPDMPVAANVVQGLGAVATIRGDAHRGARLTGLATAVRGRPDRGDLMVREVTRTLTAALGAAELDRLVAAGSAVTREDALAEVGAPPLSAWPGPGFAIQS